jgi:hypothetical protein
MKNRYQPKRGKDGIIADQIITAGHMKSLGKIQDIHEESLVQNYDIGTRLVMDDRVFRYCQAKEALTALLGGRADVMPREGAGDAVEYAAGTYQVSIPMNQYGPDYVAEQVKDYWAEGYYWAGIAAPPTGQLYRIKSSKAAAAGVTALTGGYVIATLYEPLKVKIPASTWQTSWVNPYKVCKHEHSARMTVICQPLINVQQGYYFWGQTWGPCFGQLYSTAIGRNDGDRTVFYASDGALMSSKDIDVGTAGNPWPQIAGFVITNTEPWTNQDNSAEQGGDQLYMLQLSP